MVFGFVLFSVSFYSVLFYVALLYLVFYMRWFAMFTSYLHIWCILHQRSDVLYYFVVFIVIHFDLLFIVLCCLHMCCFISLCCVWLCVALFGYNLCVVLYCDVQALWYVQVVVLCAAMLLCCINLFYVTLLCYVFMLFTSYHYIWCIRIHIRFVLALHCVVLRCFVLCYVFFF